MNHTTRFTKVCTSQFTGSFAPLFNAQKACLKPDANLLYSNRLCWSLWKFNVRICEEITCKTFHSYRRCYGIVLSH